MNLYQRGMRQLSYLLLGLLLGQLTCACDSKQLGSGGAGVKTNRTRPTALPSKKQTQSLAQAEEAAAPEPQEAPEELFNKEKPSYAEEKTRFKLGELFDLGPAAPISAAPNGVYFVTRNSRLFFAQRTGQKIKEISAPKELFFRYGAGPALTERHAYWINRHDELMQANLKTGEVKSIFYPAQGGRRVSALSVKGRDVVAFMKDVETRPIGMIWAEGGELNQLSPDGSHATSIRLVPGSPHPLAIFMEGRMNMTPVHIRTVRVTKRRVTLTPDEVVWVGPGSASLTELFAMAQPNNHAMTFLATAKNISDFGIAHFDIDARGTEVLDPTWLPYKNGIDPAPVAGDKFCGSDYVLFSRPTERAPRSPQELRVSELLNGKLGASELLVRSRAFNEISISPLDRNNRKKGALLAWTADHRSWAMILSCPKRLPSVKRTRASAQRRAPKKPQLSPATTPKAVKGSQVKATK